MFQIFKLGSSSLQRSLPLSLRSLSENHQLSVTERTCLLCKHLNISSRLQLRKQSSVTNPSLHKSQKKRRKKKTVTDILVVTDKSSSLRKATVTKLTPSDLNLLASTNLNLSELYKLKDLTNKNIREAVHTYSLVIEGIPISENALPIPKVPGDTTVDLPSDISKYMEMDTNRSYGVRNSISDKSLKEETDLEPDFHVERELEFKSLGITNAFQPEVEEEIHEGIEQEECKKDKVPKVKNGMDQKQRDQVAANTLAAYIEVCNHLKNPNRGLQALNFHQSRAQRDTLRFTPMKDINVYCSLLKGFAHKGDYTKLLHVLSIMEEEKVDLNLQCFIPIFECLGKINVHNHYLKDIRIFVKSAIQKNISFNDIMSNGVFLNNERSDVLKALQAYDPNFTPKYQKPKVWYDNYLLKHLNNWEQRNFEFNDRENKGLFTPGSMNEKIRQQVQMEEDGYVTIKTIESKAKPTKEVLHFRKALDDQYKMWAESAENAFQRDLATLSAQRRPLNLEPYMRCIPTKDFINIIVEEAKRFALGSETYSPEVTLLYKQLGAKVYARYRIFRKQKTGVLEKILEIHNQYCQEYAALHGELSSLPQNEIALNSRVQWQGMEYARAKSGASLNMDHQPWVPATLIAIGKFLYHIIMHDLKVDVNCMRPNNKHKNLLPAFYTIFRTQGRIVKEEVKPHPVLSRVYRASQPETLTFPTYEVPMVCPPVPWTSVNNGGYISSPSDLVRLPPQASCQKQRLNESDPVLLYPSLDSLNQLAAVPWKVNTKVLDVILKVFRKGGSSKLDVPESPSSLPLPPSVTPDMDKTEKYQVIKQKLQFRRKKAEMYSMWCDCLYRLSLANHFRNDVFWLPHNMDFRGRVYPVPPHLNHLGSDLARSMLVFAEARPLGPEGFDWLKIHLINLTGLKKRDSVKDRLKYANKIMNLILDSANNPISGKKWWAQSDEPWQTLACCIEIADVLRSGVDPAEYKSNFPVHQDGSCNGLQHYAALGRDSAGAFSVNLTPSDVPQDVYSAVVALVEQQRSKDEADGLEIAKVLNGFVKRKVIKQTIMTTVYGVTRFGARLQIAKQLKDIDDFPKEFVWTASSYLTGRTFESLRTMFTSTREIQDWFTECARLISGVRGDLVEWVTPLGLPIVQPYIKYRKSTVITGYDNFLLDTYEKPNVLKQKNAFPPNFIHSLDSSHMMLTSLHCERAGITFVSVHDCYWTHPSTIHIMNAICREQFVALHSDPILENLSIFLYDKYAIEEGIPGLKIYNPKCKSYYNDCACIRPLKTKRKYYFWFYSGCPPAIDDFWAPTLHQAGLHLGELRINRLQSSNLLEDGSVNELSKKKLNRLLRQVPKTGDFDIQNVLKSVYFFS